MVGVGTPRRRELSPYDRRRFLTQEWPEPLLRSPAWIVAALSTLAEPALIYHERHSPLHVMLSERPSLLAEAPLPAIQAVSDVHGPDSTWPALEPVELLQASGRWNDAVLLAKRVLDRQHTGTEGEYGRLLSEFVLAWAELLAALANSGEAANGASAKLARELRNAVTTLQSSRLYKDGGFLARLTDAATAYVYAFEVLDGGAYGDPKLAASKLEEAFSFFERQGNGGAAGRQRGFLASCWRIAAQLCSHDAAVRNAYPTSGPLLEAAKRNADVLKGAILKDVESRANCSSVLAFLTAVEDLSSLRDSTAPFELLVRCQPPFR
jgi:hypothetical protein